jgi:hypothetical protein
MTCDHIPDNRDEIPTPQVVLNHFHLHDLAGTIQSLDDSCQILLLIGNIEHVKECWWGHRSITLVIDNGIQFMNLRRIVLLKNINLQNLCTGFSTVGITNFCTWRIDIGNRLWFIGASWLPAVLLWRLVWRRIRSITEGKQYLLQVLRFQFT